MAVEFGLLLPVLIAFIVITVDMGRMAYHHNILIKAVRESGRYLSTQLPGSANLDKTLTNGTKTSWAVAKDMVAQYSTDLCSSERPNCLSTSMVFITDALSTDEALGTPLLGNVAFGSGQHNVVRVSVKGYRLPSLFTGYVLQLFGADQYVYPTVSATFVQF